MLPIPNINSIILNCLKLHIRKKMFDKIPKFLVEDPLKGTIVTAARPNLTITRNISHFKRFFSRDEDLSEPIHDHSESDLTDDSEDETRGNEQQLQRERRYPVSERRRPQYLREEITR